MARTYNDLIASDEFKQAPSKKKAALYEAWKVSDNGGYDAPDMNTYQLIKKYSPLDAKIEMEQSQKSMYQKAAAAADQQKLQPKSKLTYEQLTSDQRWKDATPRRKFEIYNKWNGDKDLDTYMKLAEEASRSTYGEDIKAGLKNSVVGMAITDEVPDYQPYPNLPHKLAYGAGNLIGRLPTDVPATVLGTLGGSLIGMPELGMAAPNLVTDNMMTAMRAKKMSDAGEQVKPLDVVTEMAQNTATGGLTMLGGAAGKELAGLAKAQRFANPMENAGQMVMNTASPALMGQDMDGTDIATNLALYGATKGIHSATTATQRAIKNNNAAKVALAEQKLKEQAQPLEGPVVEPDGRLNFGPDHKAPTLIETPKYQSMVKVAEQLAKTDLTPEERANIGAALYGTYDKNMPYGQMDFSNEWGTPYKNTSADPIGEGAKYLATLASSKGINIKDIPGVPVDTYRFGLYKDVLANAMDESVGRDIVESLAPKDIPTADVKVNGRAIEKGVQINEEDVAALKNLNDFFVKDRNVGVRKYLPEGVQHFTHDIFDNFHSVISNAGPATRKVILDPLRDAYYGARAGTEKNWKQIEQVRDSLPKDSGQRIGLYMAQQNKKLQNAGNVANTIPIELSPAERQGMAFLQNKYTEMLNKINVVREAIGHEPLQAEENYFTAFRKINEYTENGGDLFTVTNKQLSELSDNIPTPQHRQAKDIKLGHDKQKSASKIPIELDAFPVAAKYVNNAERYIHLAPVIDKVGKLANVSEINGNEVSLHPAFKQLLNDKVEVIAKGRIRLNDRTADKVVNTLAGNITRSIAAMNVHIWASQLLALNNTLLAIGPKATAYGLNKWLKIKAETAGNWVTGEKGKKYFSAMNHPEFRKATQESRVLHERFYKLQDEFDLYENSFQKKTTYNKVMDKAADIMSLPTRILDMEAAFITWVGAKEKALSELKKEYGENKIEPGTKLYKEACRRADELTVRSQAGVNVIDKAPIQHSTVGRVLSAFMNFGINNWNFTRRNLLGIGENKYNNVSVPHRLMLLTEFLVLTGAVNALYSTMQEETPFPNIASVADMENEDYWRNIFIEAASLHPGLASAKFGQSVLGPVGATLEKVRDTGVTGQNIGGGITGVANMLGIPGATQAYKTYKGVAEYGNPIYRSLLSSGYKYSQEE